MSDRERILLTIAAKLARPNFTARNPPEYGAWVDADDRDIKPGDLVLCATCAAHGKIHDWVIGWFVRKCTEGTAIIREIGGDRECEVSNEMFYAIRGIDPLLLLEGERDRFYRRVKRAFSLGSLGGEYGYRFGGLRFNGDGTATIRVREVFGGGFIDKRSVPFEIRMRWTPKTTARRILRALRVNGYGWMRFKYVPRVGHTEGETP